VARVLPAGTGRVRAYFIEADAKPYGGCNKATRQLASYVVHLLPRGKVRSHTVRMYEGPLPLLVRLLAKYRAPGFRPQCNDRYSGQQYGAGHHSQ